MSDLTPPPDENPFGSPTPQPGSTPVPPPPPAYGSVPPPPPPPPTYGAVTPPQVPPTYGAPGYGAPAYGQGYAKPQNGPGTTALVTGIVSLFCCGFILGVVAIVQGRKGMALADQGLATNRGAAQAGFVLGIVGIVLWVGWLVYTVTTGNFSSSFKVGT